MDISVVVGPVQFSDGVGRIAEIADVNGPGLESSPIAVSTKLFLCAVDGCDKSFAYQSKLERHQRQKHVANRIKEKCSNCGKQIVDLSRHDCKKIPTGKAASSSAGKVGLSYFCPLCDKSDLASVHEVFTHCLSVSFVHSC
jgi:hypothetical protein